MNTFTIENIINPDLNAFDRQERIEWWSQKKISQAKIMVVGAGAIGNETLKNLALLGVAKIFVVDFDTVSTSNLSRTVLFRKSDVGKRKAEVAAERTKELSLVADPKIDWYHGDIVWELGTGIFKDMDLVLGCLDNIETRFHVNRQCILGNTPWIDSGINELGAHVSFYLPSSPPCYECGMTKEQSMARRQRYSCDHFKKALLQEGKTPTVQIASAIAAAIQVQEAIKYICNQQVSAGKKIYYQGKINDFDVNHIPVNAHCQAHVSYPEVIQLPVTSSISLREFLTHISQADYSGQDSVLDMSSDRHFVISVNCRSCGNPIEFYRPNFSIFDSETVCKECVSKGINTESFDPNQVADKSEISKFSLKLTEDRILNLSLREIGVPLWHILTVRDNLGRERQYELLGDKEVLLPNITAEKT